MNHLELLTLDTLVSVVSGYNHNQLTANEWYNKLEASKYYQPITLMSVRALLEEAVEKKLLSKGTRVRLMICIVYYPTEINHNQLSQSMEQDSNSVSLLHLKMYGSTGQTFHFTNQGIEAAMIEMDQIIFNYKAKTINNWEDYQLLLLTPGVHPVILKTFHEEVTRKLETHSNGETDIWWFKQCPMNKTRYVNYESS